MKKNVIYSYAKLVKSAANPMIIQSYDSYRDVFQSGWPPVFGLLTIVLAL